MPSITIALPATLGSLGIGQGGLKVVKSLEGEGWDVSTISVAGDQPTAGGSQHQSLSLRPVFRVAMRSPIRLREGWLVNTHYVAFDLLARSRIRKTDFFYGYSQGSLRCFGRAHALGAQAVLHAATSYVPQMKAWVDAEYRALGLAPVLVTRSLARRAVLEYQRADVVRVQSRMVRDTLIAGGIAPRKISFVPPAVDLDAFSPAESAPSRFTIAFVGAFSIRKGFHQLLRAWDTLTDTNARLILHGGAGDRWGKGLLERYRMDPRVEVRSGPPHQTYRDASVAVVPSIEDGFCYVVLEALASGIPVILSDRVGAKDAIDDSCGFVTAVGEPDALVERLIQLRDDAAMRNRMRRGARVRAAGYSFAIEGRRLSEALQNSSRELSAVTARAVG